jgi:predicted PurR-regulated permease PerM
MAGRVGLKIGETRGETSGEGEGDAQSSERVGQEGWPPWIEKHVQEMGSWAARGLGGVAGVLGHLLLVLAFTYYLLSGRAEWRGRIESMIRRIGLGRCRNELDEAQREIRLYARFLVLVGVGIGVLVGLMAWGLGLPTPFAWGLLAGLLEFVPFFGPIIAGGLLALVALATTDGLFAPVTILVAYAVLQQIEGYVITPLLYGSTVRLNPVVVLLGVLVFGFIWGPVGLVIAVPMLILLKTLIELVPDTPALDALVEEREGQAEA